jgi:hypothetical protein
LRRDEEKKGLEKSEKRSRQNFKGLEFGEVEDQESLQQEGSGQESRRTDLGETFRRGKRILERRSLGEQKRCREVCEWEKRIEESLLRREERGEGLGGEEDGKGGEEFKEQIFGERGEDMMINLLHYIKFLSTYYDPRKRSRIEEENKK